MADIDSYGYNGSIKATDWPLMQLNPNYYVETPSALVCTPVASGTRQVSFSVGGIGGYNVRDKVNTAQVVTLPSVTSGTQYFMIVLRRAWTDTGGTSSLAVINAASGSTLLPTRNDSPGSVADQPLAMVPLTAGQTVPGTPVDLRVLGTGDGFRYIRSKLALQYLKKLGEAVWLGDTLWRCRLNAAGNDTEWVSDPGVSGRLALPTLMDGDWGSGVGGWTRQNCRLTRNGNEIQIDYQACRNGGTISCDSTGYFGAALVTTLLDSTLFPDYDTPFNLLYSGGPQSTDHSFRGGTGVVRQYDGSIALFSGIPNFNLNTQSDTTATSLRFCAKYTIASAKDAS